MNYLIVSYHISKTGSSDIAKLTWDEEKLASMFSLWQDSYPVEEMMYLATCNRAEFLIYSQNSDKILENLSEMMPVDISKARIYSAEQSVVQHLLEVGLSMDSLVFGENQILGQIKDAYRIALKHGLCSKALSPLIQNILKHSKKIRTRNHLSNIHSSISSVAAKDYLIHGENNANILLVGAGESNRLVARYLSKRSIKSFTWANRSLSRAQEAAELIGGDYISWADYKQANLKKFDAVFLTTNAGEYIFFEDHLKATSAKRVYDLSIPPNADQELVQKSSAEYIGMEVLQLVLEKEKQRYNTLRKVIDKDIAQSVSDILKRLNQNQLSPIISESLQNIDQVVTEAMDNLPKDLRSLSDSQLKSLKLWTRKIVQKTKHEHISQIRKLKETEND